MRQTIQNLCFLFVVLVAGCATLRTGYRRCEPVRWESEQIELLIELPDDCEQPKPQPRVTYNPEDLVA